MVARRIGLVCLILHSMLYGWTITALIGTTDAQSGLLWVPLMIVDFPVSLIAIWPGDYWNYYEWISQWNSHALDVLFSPTSLAFGILGSLWWYYLPVPRLFMPARWGGIW